jgi:hemoglobin-like flavoprotein
MTPAQIIMVRKSWKQLTPVFETAAVLFYSKLLYLDPEIEQLFKSDIEQQGFKLMKMIAIMVEQLECFETVVPVLKTLGRRYAEQGVRTEHYQAMGYAFLWMLQQILDKEFTPELKQAWAKTYVLLARTMLDAVPEPAEAA